MECLLKISVLYSKKIMLQSSWFNFKNGKNNYNHCWHLGIYLFGLFSTYKYREECIFYRHIIHTILNLFFHLIHQEYTSILIDINWHNLFNGYIKFYCMYVLYCIQWLPYFNFGLYFIITYKTGMNILIHIFLQIFILFSYNKLF